MSTAATAKSDPWADLVNAILSVNNHPLERTFHYFEGLRREGLFDPAALPTLDEEEIARRLGRAGYDRGPTMTDRGAFTPWASSSPLTDRTNVKYFCAMATVEASTRSSARSPASPRG